MRKRNYYCFFNHNTDCFHHKCTINDSVNKTQYMFTQLFKHIHCVISFSAIDLLFQVYICIDCVSKLVCHLCQDTYWRLSLPQNNVSSVQLLQFWFRFTQYLWFVVFYLLDKRFLRPIKQKVFIFDFTFLLSSAMSLLSISVLLKSKPLK